MSRARLAAGLLAALFLGWLPATAAADPYLPPPGKVWSGVTAGFDVDDFEARAGKHPAIWQHFIAGAATTSTRSRTRAGPARG